MKRWRVIVTADGKREERLVEALFAWQAMLDACRAGMVPSGPFTLSVEETSSG